MTTFVLFMLFIGKTPQAASWTAEFTSREACMTAGVGWEQSLKAEGTVIYMCASKDGAAN